MSTLPTELRYTKQHEWVKVDGETLTVGITAHAVEQLGEITMVTLPDVGSDVEAEQAFGDIDSVKAVSELYAPVDGTVSEINDALDETPELVNDDPYEKGWMIRITVKDAAQLESLMDATAYQAFVDAEG